MQEALASYLGRTYEFSYIQDGDTNYLPALFSSSSSVAWCSQGHFLEGYGKKNRLKGSESFH
jgi:hypothetical protein